MASPPLEGRLLLVRERRHAALEILGAAARRDRPDLELHLRLEALPRRVVEEPLRAPECERLSVRELARERLHGAGELRIGHDARHEPPLESLAGREDAVGEVELHRPTARRRTSCRASSACAGRWSSTSPTASSR